VIRPATWCASTSHPPRRPPPPACVAFAGPEVDGPQLSELVGELSGQEPDFRRLWSRHDVKPIRGACPGAYPPRPSRPDRTRSSQTAVRAGVHKCPPRGAWSRALARTASICGLDAEDVLDHELVCGFVVAAFGVCQQGGEVLITDRLKCFGRERRRRFAELRGAGFVAGCLDRLIGIECCGFGGEDLVIADAAASERRVDVDVVLAAIRARIEMARPVIARALEQPHRQERFLEVLRAEAEVLVEARPILGVEINVKQLARPQRLTDRLRERRPAIDSCAISGFTPSISG